MMRIRLSLLREYVRAVREAEEQSDVQDVVLNRFTPWPTAIRRMGPRTYAKGEGYGPGERWVARLVGGKVVGGHSQSFDIESPMYGKIEVKEPSDSINGKVRVETEGIAALEANYTRIKNVIKRIDSVFGERSRRRTAEAAQRLYPPAVYGQIVNFCTVPDDPKGKQTAIQWIMRGEMGMARLNRFAEILRLISSGLKHPVKEEKYVELGDTDTGVNRRAGDLSTDTFIKVAKAMNIDPQELEISPVEVLRSTLSGAAFTNPETFISSTLKGAVKPSQVFHQTDFVCFVRPEGYVMIPKESYDDRIEFISVSKGKPYFKLRK